MRLYLYFNYLIKLHCDKAEQQKMGESLEGVKNLVRSEFLVTFETYLLERLRRSCDFSELESKVIISFISECLVKRIKTLKLREEVSIQTGYQVEDYGHCIYVSFRRLSEDEFIIRVDNRWLSKKGIDASIHGNPPWVKKTGNQEVIKPFLSEHSKLRILKW
jgi:hypothetical protein